MLRLMVNLLKDNFKEHQITTLFAYERNASELKDNFKEHQITTGARTDCGTPY